MTAQFARASYSGRPAGSIQHNPQAGLLIDFDNVTMGIRSDLSKELKNLLNSDIIKGKVAVQRAYADWRRYPQYIVPLAEASVDLIFAPAYGSSKKNATDIRLAIDALELVFTRPEIGTFILLSGDSDFSSLVLKLKEYGKYVIGVGIRESASDLLVQNCDEYYSYSALTGLTKAGDEGPVASNDPWELVEIAVRQMADSEDVMRSDRLKQVLLELDPGFDEKTLGFSKFNRFVQEAANRGLLRLQKMENGQFEVALPTAEGGEPPPRAERPERDEERGDGRRRGRRGGRGRRDERGRRNGGGDGAAEESRAEEPDAGEAQTEEPAAPREVARSEPEPVAPEAGSADGINGAYALLRRAVKDVGRGGTARDSDVKRRMLEITPGFDESTFGFSKFSRFLRQAHEQQIVDVRKLENGSYEVALGDSMPEPTREDRPRRGRDRAEPESRRQAEPEPQVAVEPKPARQPEPKPEAVREEAPAPKKAEPPKPAEAVAGVRSIGLRRGSRGRPNAAAPPPLLEGQAVGVGPAETPPAKEEPKPEPVAASADAPVKKRSRRGRGKRATEPKETVATPAPKPTGKPAPKPERREPRAPAKKGGFDAGSLGLPTRGVEVVGYLAQNYKGVGQKMAESLVEAFGADTVFSALHQQPERVKQILGEKRGEKLLELWHDDYAFRLANSTDPEKQKKAAEEAAARGARGPRGGGRGRRGGRGRKAAKKS